MKKFKLGILGVGKMGSSILEGIIKASLFKKDEILLFDTNNEIKNEYVKKDFTFTDNEKDLVEHVDILLLAIKPQMLYSLKNTKFDIENILVISIVAGKNINDLQEIFGNQRFIRVMPNTPALINEGATAIGRNNLVNEEELNIVCKIFSSIGGAKIIPDELLNEVIPLNGSMPAYLYYFAKCFIEKGVKDGITYEDAKELVSRAIIGSAKMIIESNKDIDTLINDVCSPKGATLEGMNVLKESNFKEIIEETSEKTVKRAYELSKI